MKPVRDELLDLCEGDEEAVDFIVQLWNFFVTWDDAVDRDKHGSDADINIAMMWGLFGLHDSAFYSRHATVLRPVIMKCIADWLVANKFEASREPLKLEHAYFLRCSPYDVFAIVVLLVAGFEQQLKAIEFFHTIAPEDSLANYLQEHRHGMA